VSTEAEGLDVLKNYTDHAANERTYLAWVRTGIATAVFGFVIEKLDLFLVELPDVAADRLRGEIGPFGDIRVLSILLVVIGIGIILLSTWHFFKTKRAIEREDQIAYDDMLPAYVLSALLAVAGGFLLFTLLRLV
jgi:inner membrane protein YidH